MKSGNLNFLEPSGPLRACNGSDLPLPLHSTLFNSFLVDDLIPPLVFCTMQAVLSFERSGPAHLKTQHHIREELSQQRHRWENLKSLVHKNIHKIFPFGPKPVKSQLYQVDFYLILSHPSGLGVASWPLVPKFAGSAQAKADGFLGRKNPQHAFLQRGSKAVGPMS